MAAGKTMAVLLTKDEYDNYDLRVRYRWGDKTHGNREKKSRLGCVLVHAGDDPAHGPFPQSVVVVVQEGAAGTVRLLAASGRLTALARAKESPDRRRREFVGGAATELRQVTGEPEGWDGTIWRKGFPPFLNDTKGWRPPGDPTNPNRRAWNNLLIECAGGTLRVFVNNKLQNELTDLNVRKGRIGFTSQLADWQIERIALKPRKRPASD